MEKLTAQILNSRLPYAFGNEIEYLEELARSLPAKSEAVILGAGPGIQTMALLEGNPDLYIMAVDHDQAVLDTYVKHLRAAGDFKSPYYYGDTCDPFLFDQLGFGKFHTIKLLIVDADHSYEAVVRDVNAWWKVVDVGGYIFFHDVIDLERTGTNGVRRAIDDLLQYGPMKDHAELVASHGISEVYRKL